MTERIVMDPAICNGKPTVRGYRLTVQTVLLGAGESREELLHQYPYLEEEDVNACLRFAAEIVSDRSRTRTADRMVSFVIDANLPRWFHPWDAGRVEAFR